MTLPINPMKNGQHFVFLNFYFCVIKQFFIKPLNHHFWYVQCKKILKLTTYWFKSLQYWTSNDKLNNTWSLISSSLRCLDDKHTDEVTIDNIWPFLSQSWKQIDSMLLWVFASVDHRKCSLINFPLLHLMDFSRSHCFLQINSYWHCIPLTFYTVTSICLFSLLLSTHFLMGWQGEFV